MPGGRREEKEKNRQEKKEGTEKRGDTDMGWGRGRGVGDDDLSANIAHIAARKVSSNAI